MSDHIGEVLPYRGDVMDLFRVIEALGRGRSVGEVQALDFTERTFQGTLATAKALGFVDGDAGELTEIGERLALASDEVAKRAVLQERIIDYEPFGRLLEAVFAKGDVHETETKWFETWWNRQGYGASANNRGEAAGAFANLAEAVGLGQFVRGRRGRSSRVVWAKESGEAVRTRRYSTGEASSATEAQTNPPKIVAPDQDEIDYAVDKTPPVESLRPRQDALRDHRLEITLSQGRRALVVFPTEGLTPLDRRFLGAALEMALDYLGALNDESINGE